MQYKVPKKNMSLIKVIQFDSHMKLRSKSY